MAASEAKPQTNGGELDTADLSFEGGGRSRQFWDLHRQSVCGHVDLEERPPPASATGLTSLMVFIKDRPRGVGYVADFVYRCPDALPVSVYGTIVNTRRGLVINELELWRPDDWEYRDEEGTYVGPDGEFEVDPDAVNGFVGISSATLREVPVGWILNTVAAELNDRSWEDGDLFLITSPGLGDDERRQRRGEMEQLATLTLDRSAAEVDSSSPPKRGRPPLTDDLLQAVANAYLDEVPAGPGLHARLSERFDRPESTVRDWVLRARQAGYLSAGRSGRRGATPGPRLQRSRPAND
ncbi:MAG: hypothetical protein ACSLFI_06955 [Solirubrobacterales bacterium]